MPSNIRNVLLEVVGESDDAQRSLSEIAASLRALPDSRTVEVRAEVRKARQNIERMRQDLLAINRDRASPEIKVQISKALLDLENFDKRLEDISKEKVSVDVELRRDRLQVQIDRVEATLDKLSEDSATVTIDASISGAVSTIARLEDRLRKIPDDTDIEIQIKRELLEQQISAAYERLEALETQKRTIEIDVDAKTEAALAELMRLEAAIAALPDDTEIQVRVSRGILGDLNQIDSGITNMVRGLDAASRPASGFGDALSNVAQVVRVVRSAAVGFGGVIFAFLIPGLIAVGASAVSAAAGLGVLAAAFAGALGPAVVLAIGVIARFAKVLEALKLQDAAADASSRKSAAGSAAAAAAAEQRHGAELGLRDALQGQVTAERAVGAAREQAAQQLQSAAGRVADAQRAVEAASRQVEDAVVAGYKAIEEAAERASDAIRNVAESETGLDRAELNIKKAEQALAEYRDGLSATADLSDDLRKFTDVAVDFDISGLQATLGAAGVESNDQIELADRILAVREAKDAERAATDALSDAEKESTEARKENVRYQREGLAAFRPLQDAIRGQQAAQRSLNDATAEYGRLSKVGIDNAPGVVAANEALRDSNERLAEARRTAARAGREIGLTDAQQRAKQATDDLTTSELGFLAVLKRVRAELNAGFGTAIDTVFGGLARALDKSATLLNPLRNGFIHLGNAVADVIDRFSAFLIRPENIASFQVLVDASGELVRVLGNDVFQSLLSIFLDIAVVAMPLLLAGLREFAGFLKGLATQTGNVGTLQPIIEAMVASFRVFADLGLAVLDVLLAIALTAGPIGDGLVKELAGALRGLAAFLRTAEGKNKVKDFFDDTIPAVKALVKFLVVVVKVLLRIIQFVGPLVAGFVNGITFVIGLIDFLLGLLNAITANPVGRWVKNLIGGFLGIGAVLRLFGKLVAVIGSIGGTVGSVVARLGGYLVKPFTDANRAIIAVLSRLPGRAGAFFAAIPKALSKAVTGALGAIRNTAGLLIRTFLGGMRSYYGAILGLGRTVLSKIIEGIRLALALVTLVAKLVITRFVSGVRSVFGSILTAGRAVVSKIVEGVRAAASKIYDIGRFLLEGLIRGFTTITRVVRDAIKGLAEKIVDAVKKVLGIDSPSKVMRKLGEFMLAGLIEGFTSGNILDFVKAALGGIAGLAADLAKSAVVDFPLSVIGKVGDIAGGALGALTPLATGGVTRGATAALIGEQRGVREAVLPLSRRVLRQLAEAIMSSLGTFSPMPAMAGSGRGALAAPAFAGGRPGTHIDKVEWVTRVPGGGHPDPVAQSAAFARLIEDQFAGDLRG